MYCSAVTIVVYICLNTIHELFQAYQQRWHYLLDPINLVSWLLYISASVTVVPIFTGNVMPIQYSCASLTVFLSWFNLLLLLQRFDQVGIYVVMFLEILQTLIKVLLVFSILIVAFGLAFYILLSDVSLAVRRNRLITYFQIPGLQDLQIVTRKAFSSFLYNVFNLMPEIKVFVKVSLICR